MSYPIQPRGARDARDITADILNEAELLHEIASERGPSALGARLPLSGLLRLVGELKDVTS